MYGLAFENQAPPAASDPNRADVALFVGFVGRRNTDVPQGVWRWLREHGWRKDPPKEGTTTDELSDVPVPIDTWDVFDHLFAWDSRPLTSPVDSRAPTMTSYLGAAVRSFFAQGGRKCYVVRVDDPWPFTTSRKCRLGQIVKLIPGYPSSLVGSPAADRESWQGITHLYGLPDVSFLCLPDLADAVGVERTQLEPIPVTPDSEEQFVECSGPETKPSPDRQWRRWLAPRCDEAGYKDWAKALWFAADLVARYQREVQVVAAVPIPCPETDAERDLLGFLTDAGRWSPSAPPLSSAPIDSESIGALASAFVQLTYPWLRTVGSINLAELLESPDGVLAGLLARNALTRGTFRSAANLHLSDAYDVYPILQRDQMLTRHDDTQSEKTARHNLLERVSLFGPTPQGLRLLSDVTASLAETYRPASVNRLIASIVRAAGRLGEDIVFEPSGENLWGRLRYSLVNLLSGLLEDGALRGTTPSEAFSVRCDRSTMSQSDIDNGRVVAVVAFDAAAPVDRITVGLALDEFGSISRVSMGATQGEGL